MRLALDGAAHELGQRLDLGHVERPVTDLCGAGDEVEVLLQRQGRLAGDREDLQPDLLRHQGRGVLLQMPAAIGVRATRSSGASAANTFLRAIAGLRSKLSATSSPMTSQTARRFGAARRDVSRRLTSGLLRRARLSIRAAAISSSILSDSMSMTVRRWVASASVATCGCAGRRGWPGSMATADPGSFARTAELW